ncbi:MAG: hypothetical protein IJ681_00335 [Bacteroidales bacterium]|nr:hypothetical protein [Bacteroidales bacterium]
MSEIVKMATCFDCRRCIEKQQGLTFHEKAGLIPRILPYCTLIGKIMENYSACEKSFIKR